MTEKLDKILGIYYENPNKRFTVRELANITRIPKSTAQKYLMELKKEGLILGDKRASNSRLFKIKKINYIIEEIVESSLIEFLEEQLKPEVIILFGSFRKGESEKGSDIDLFVESLEEKELDLSKFEKKLKHSIHLFVEKNINQLPDNFKNNVINGIKLQGFLRIR